jgi:hypothetical protein
MLMSPHTYQGNGWMIAFAIFSLFLMAQVILGARARHKAGIPVDIKPVIGQCLLFLVFVATAVYQVLTH